MTPIRGWVARKVSAAPAAALRRIRGNLRIIREPSCYRWLPTMGLDRPVSRPCGTRLRGRAEIASILANFSANAQPATARYAHLDNDPLRRASEAIGNPLFAAAIRKRPPLCEALNILRRVTYHSAVWIGTHIGIRRILLPTEVTVFVVLFGSLLGRLRFIRMHLRQSGPWQ